jgi:enoyl-CoA hydratase
MSTQSFENLLFTVSDSGIATITINRPDKMNALNRATIAEIRAAVERVTDDKNIKGAIITGSGPKAFVAGADIQEFKEQSDITARRFAENGQEAFQMIEDSAKPFIAAINGFALGGGCELAMACHIRLASENAKFGQPEVKLGLIPGYGGTQRLTRLIGKSKALELMLTGDMINATEALHLGLLNYVLPTQEGLLAKATELINKITAMAPIAVGLIIDSVNAYYTDQNSFNTEANNFAACFRTEDMREGVNAFLEKRAPEFKNK